MHNYIEYYPDTRNRKKSFFRLFVDCPKRQTRKKIKIKISKNGKNKK